ncbi:MAG: hypothetical protein JWM80_6239 [Cyanobacteria bacterium RYN_339]|nr:hypothetical protein [Cyanobacteria bacterium RYN_339]
MKVKGLPIGQGEVWHDRPQRTLALALGAAALAPLAAWVLPAAGWLDPGRFGSWVELPLLAVIAAIALFAVLRRRALATRVGIGLVVGLVGASSYDLVLLLGRQLAPGLALPLAGMDAASWGVNVHHLLGTAAVWGLGYAVLAGKARWYFGVAWAALIWGVIALMAALLPEGARILPATPLVLLTLLAAHVMYGVAIGALNEVLQPAARGQGKIIFLRDYQQKIKQR